ncbi:MAG: glutamate--tRNA ligase [Candidatus Colwellbacteria bacterium]|nr:glutamate--tRNA ligase [Candidatus Colwellbacteria bacterium]
MDNKRVKVRFAPSPTGWLHIGGARTALFNWLFAKANGGEFILRIEDTDRERSKKEFEEGILSGLKWLGLEWDELIRQSERREVYKEYLEQLIASKAAYYCFCTKEELEGAREGMVVSGLPPKYSGRCRALTDAEIEGKKRAGAKNVIRFKMPEKKVIFKDTIRGTVTFDAALFGDQVIAKSLIEPLYNFANVVDDSEMQITHVIRGEEHLANTPRQILIAEALGLASPSFAHIPLILNPDRSKMSKRFADVALKDYISGGYLPDAMFNFLAFLGWHPREDKDIMSRNELVKEFELERVQKAGAVFNIEKLNWLNSHYINRLSSEEFTELAQKYLPDDWKFTNTMAESVRSRVKNLGEVKDLASFYFNLPNYDKAILLWKKMPPAAAEANLSNIAKILEGIDNLSFTKENLEKILIEKTKDLPKGEVFWPLRVALSGAEKSPTPFEIMEALGKIESLDRIMRAINKLRE